MIICTHFHSNPVLFSYVNEDSMFFVCWCNEQLSSVSRTFPSEVPIRRFLIRSTSVRRSSDSSTQELHRMMVINYKDDFFFIKCNKQFKCSTYLDFYLRLMASLAQWKTFCMSRSPLLWWKLLVSYFSGSVSFLLHRSECTSQRFHWGGERGSISRVFQGFPGWHIPLVFLDRQILILECSGCKYLPNLSRKHSVLQLEKMCFASGTYLCVKKIGDWTCLVF